MSSEGKVHSLFEVVQAVETAVLFVRRIDAQLACLPELVLHHFELLRGSGLSQAGLRWALVVA